MFPREIAEKGWYKYSCYSSTSPFSDTPWNGKSESEIDLRPLGSLARAGAGTNLGRFRGFGLGRRPKGNGPGKPLKTWDTKYARNHPKACLGRKFMAGSWDDKSFLDLVSQLKPLQNWDPIPSDSLQNVFLKVKWKQYKAIRNFNKHYSEFWKSGAG